jgi:hypothetical protein
MLAIWLNLSYPTLTPMSLDLAVAHRFCLRPGSRLPAACLRGSRARSAARTRAIRWRTDRGTGEPGAVTAGGRDRRFRLRPVEVDDVERDTGPRADVGIRPPTPPLLDRSRVRGGVVQGVAAFACRDEGVPSSAERPGRPRIPWPHGTGRHRRAPSPLINLVARFRRVGKR